MRTAAIGEDYSVRSVNEMEAHSNDMKSSFT